MYIYVNQREIDGKLYTAKRDNVNPKDQIIECDGEQKPCRIKDVWASDDAVRKLWL
jgi:hypothetical protein